MKQHRAVLRQWAPLLIWMGVIFIVSHQPSVAIPEYGRWDLLVKKGGHLIAYGVLAILARRTSLNESSVLLLALVYATSDELHQRVVPGRTGTLIDVVIDFLGAEGALLFLRLLPLTWREALLGQRDTADEP